VAIIKLGPVVQAASGTIGATNFVNAARTVYIRKSRRSTNSTSKAQLLQQTAMNSLVRQWNSLTVSQRNTWTTAAKYFPHKNKLGIPATLTGREFFFFRNLRNLSAFNIAIETSPPPMTMSPNYAGWSLANPDTNTLTLTHNYGAPAPLPLLMWWGARTYSNAPRKLPTNWTPLWSGGTFASSTNILPMFVGNSGVLGAVTIRPLGRPSLNEIIFVKGVARWNSNLDTQPVYASIAWGFA
jgi:hypothetical protein